MSTRQKEFIRRIRQASSERDEVLRYRKMGEAGSSYLKSRYSDSAIELIEKTFLRKFAEDEIPAGIDKVFLEAARYYSRKGEFERAEELLDKVEESRNVTISLQARYEIDLIKIKKQLEQGAVDIETIEDIKDIVKDDEDHELETSNAGKFSDYDLFRSYFGDRIPVKELTEEIFPPSMKKTPGTRVPPNPDIPPHPSNNGYNEGLSANNRLKFLVENFPITSGSRGDGNFKGAILFEIEGSDLVIVENFWRQTREGEFVEDYGKATYILPKDQAIDLIKLSRGEIIAKDNPRIVTVRHSSKEYYNNLVERFNAAQNADLQKIKQQTNPLEPTGNEIVESEDVQNTDSVEIEPQAKETSEEPIPAADTKKRKNTIDFTAENQKFLSSINTNMGNIINPEIMEELLKRASYSFKNLYDKKLKEGIIERLEILEIPEDKRELEAQKVFLYLRMAKNISMINSGAINGDNLDKVLDDSTIEYSEGISFFEKHIGDGLTYKDLKKLMQQYVETGIDPLESTQENENSLLDESQTIQQDTDMTSSEPSEELDTLVEGDETKETKIEVLDFATRYMELLEKLEKVNAESERLDQKLAEKEQSHIEKQQATILAKEAEEKARLATIKATEQETQSSQELDEIRAERERIEQEKRDLQEKKKKIDDILR